MLSVEEKALLTVGVVSAFFLFIYLVSILIICIQASKAIEGVLDSKKDQLNILSKKSDNESGDNDADTNNTSDLLYIDFIDRKRYIVSLIMATFAVVFVMLTLLVLVMFDKLPIAAGVILMSLLGCGYWISFAVTSNAALIGSTLHRHPIVRWAHRVYWKLLHRKFQWILGFVGIIGIVLILNLALWGVCENNLKIVDTRLMRRYMSPTCPAGPPCLVYLTLNEDPSTSIIVNYHTSKSAPSTQCRYDTSSFAGASNISATNSVIGQQYTMPYLEVSRFVHWVHLTGLQPDTTYYFSCGSDRDGWSVERKFKTQSNDPNRNYTFVVGGDVDTTSTAAQISAVAAKQSPMFALVGGDLAYDRAQYSCYRIIDKWLDMWQKIMVTPDGTTIPIVAAIGNHEVIGDYDATKDRIPYFLRYFPQMLKQDDPGSSVDDRKSYGAVSIGGPNGTVIMRLDSGHTTAAPLSTQAGWMINKLENQYKNALYRFSIYHVPAYPTIRAYETSHSVDIRENWIPIFDQFKFQISFENHDHAYKRTLPLIGDEIAHTSSGNSNGTIYMGDGNWGVHGRPIPDSRWYQAFTKQQNYILRVDINPSQISFKALDTYENIFDSGVINQS